jgi:glucokinase
MTSNLPPAFLQPIDSTHMRRVNRSVILELVRQRSPIARSEISRELGLSMPTVMRLVDELIEEGLIRSTGETAGKTGRPRELLEYNKEGYSVIGIDLGGTKLYGALANIGGEIQEEVRLDQHNTSGEESFERVCNLIESLIGSASNPGQRILGIAVGAPGVTHFRPGVVEWAPSLDWRNFPLKARLEERFHLPTVIENDVNLAVLGEQWFGAGKGVQNMVLLSIGTGLGAGLIIDGIIYRGHDEAAGEAGYLLPGIHALGKHYDQFGAMENIVSGTGIAERAKEKLARKIPEEILKTLTSSEVFDAARKKEEWAVQIVAETVDYLSLVIANTATLINPELIVLGGGVSNSADLLLEPIQKRIEGVIQHVPRIEVSTLGSQATVMGAITLTVHTTKDYFVVRRLY